MLTFYDVLLKRIEVQWVESMYLLFISVYFTNDLSGKFMKMILGGEY